MTTQTTPTTATDRQRWLIDRLLRTREVSGTVFEGWEPDWSRSTKRTASQVIERLSALPEVSTPPITGSGHPSDPQAGVYSYAGDQYARVYRGQKSGRMLAKRIHLENDGTWTLSYEYLGLARTVLGQDATRLTLEEVGELGVHSGWCLVCGRRLDDPESVDRGIGPVCAINY